MLKRVLGLAIVVSSSAFAQPNNPVPPVLADAFGQPDAQRLQQELSTLLQRYPPTLRNVLALDPSLLMNQSYLAPYPALANFLNTHPEIARNPSFYIGEPERREREPDTSRTAEEIVTDLSIFAGFALAMCLIAWLIKTFIDYRRWNRLTNLQTEVHTKLLDRFAASEDLLSYMRTPAGSRFLESSPIVLDAGPRSVSAPMGRILWTTQGGVVLIAAGIGFLIVSGRVAYDVSQALRVLGVLAIAIGFGLAISAIISFMISRRMGLLEGAASPRPEANPQG
ncbi:MAG: hypothetical protein JO307_13460 [Bryobacterales bacterium]|nr:hypothetical protein [Bryobacterales bacterium]MBV9398724.1 hypothetical protein [Bryobacterales bacterium]